MTAFRICAFGVNFYPRPPGGGRLYVSGENTFNGPFLSTPSGWRATFLILKGKVQQQPFLSTPSGWRATGHQHRDVCGCDISIHALRVEGDEMLLDLPVDTLHFYPRPPGGGRPAWRH